MKTLTTDHLGPELAAANDALYEVFLELWPGRRNAKRSAVEAHGSTTVPADDPTYLQLLFDYPLDEEAAQVAEQLIRFKARQHSLTKGKGILARLDPGGRIHAELNTVGAVTGRMTAARPNMQNFSKRDPRLRGLFAAEPATPSPPSTSTRWSRGSRPLRPVRRR